MRTSLVIFMRGLSPILTVSGVATDTAGRMGMNGRPTTPTLEAMGTAAVRSAATPSATLQHDKLLALHL